MPKPACTLVCKRTLAFVRLGSSKVQYSVNTPAESPLVGALPVYVTATWYQLLAERASGPLNGIFASILFTPALLPGKALKFKAGTAPLCTRNCQPRLLLPL